MDIQGFISGDMIKLELVKLARDLCINEYNERRANDHNIWLAHSDHLWKTQQMRVTYPPFPPYPTEVDVVAKAQLLLDFMNSIPQEKINKTVDDNAVDIVVDFPTLDPAAPEIIPDTVSSIETVESPIPEVITNSDVEYLKSKITNDIKEDSPSSKKLIHTLMRKLDSLKSDFKKGIKNSNTGE